MQQPRIKISIACKNRIVFFSYSLYLLGSRSVLGQQEGWLVFDITSATRDWVEVQESNLGIRVAVETREGI